MNNHRTLIFTIAVLYSIKAKWRGIGSSQSFEDIVKNRNGVNLHIAWLKLKRIGLLGEFGKQFYFDALYSTSNLTEILAEALNPYGLIRLGGTDLSYHLDMISQDVIQHFLRQQKIPAQLIEQISGRLDTLLDEQEKATNPQPNR